MRYWLESSYLQKSRKKDWHKHVEANVVSLFDKILGIEAATAVGVAMRDITEGMSFEDIDSEFGTLCELLPHEYPEKFRKQEWGHDFHVKAHKRPAGMCEYGQALLKEGHEKLASSGKILLGMPRDLESAKQMVDSGERLIGLQLLDMWTKSARDVIEYLS